MCGGYRYERGGCQFGSEGPWFMVAKIWVKWSKALRGGIEVSPSRIPHSIASSYPEKKKKEKDQSLFTALLHGTWMIFSKGGICWATIFWNWDKKHCSEAVEIVFYREFRKVSNWAKSPPRPSFCTNTAFPHSKPPCMVVRIEIFLS